ncbi:MAG: M13 family metallopeptidase [Gemmatimonadaceae bacterium]
MTDSFRFERRSFGRAALVAFATVIFVPRVNAQTGGHALGIDTASFDHSVRPQDDFFRFVNGGWINRTAIPQDASSWGAFNELRETSRTALHSILDDDGVANAAPGSERRKVGDLYASFMDSARVERLGLSPLRDELTTIAAIKSPPQLAAAFAHFARLGIRGPLAVGVTPDPKRSDVNVVVVNQAGLGLPDRDYYLLGDAKMRAIRQAYESYIVRLLTLAQQPDASGAAARIIALETAIAGKQWDRARTRDRNATYNMMTVPRLAALSPSYDWKEYLAHAGLAKATEVVVRQPDYVQALDSIIRRTAESTWREYLTFKLVDAFADDLPSAFQQARFEFRGRTLSGQPAMPARWKRGVDEVDEALGEAVGKIYVERNFRPEAKARMDAIVRNLRLAYQVGIDSLDWMSPATKAQAKDKLAKFTVKIAYPEQWRDYSSLDIRRDDLLGNVERAAAFQYDDMVDRLGKPVDRLRWGMTPPTVNAYYNPGNNEIVFPAGILQPPFFDVNADDAVNYGGIGAVIGHEIGHGFDDQGRKSDGAGNLRDWWTPADAAAFEQRATRLGAQYEAISPVEGTHINSRLTMGENIGDLSGLAQAYRAYHLSLGGKEAPVIGGYTGDQRFFLGFAQIWRTKIREEAMRQQLLSNPHSPGMYRAFIPLINNDAFQRAFDVKPGDRMYLPPAERVRIW